MGSGEDWLEVGDRVFTRRYRFYDQQIGVVLGEGEALVIDTRTTPGQARELIADIGQLTPVPVRVVVNTHWHHDHTFGNHDFRPAVIWGHARCRSRLLAEAATVVDSVAANLPALVAELREVEIDPPDRTFEDAATFELGGRLVDLRYLGRGHTDNDIVVEVPDAGVARRRPPRDDAVPYFGDGFPLGWPATVERLLGRVSPTVVPGRSIGDRAFVGSSATSGGRGVARRLHAGEIDRPTALSAMPFEPASSIEPLDRPGPTARRPRLTPWGRLNIGRGLADRGVGAAAMSMR
jgi:glyoxylase-like metal-dependent hydrolase (beta-lactamase superfamily II)